ncbi:RNA polymerase sigma factor [Acetonema longum]|uniref:RNA polymerase sigma factor 70 region 4 type 2 domain-containing protein n=1 Tax=Acetonema longum DSM 6540 TaxID=1009370 RepID=F7NNT6_9FIRM|nr:sigma-70 family RNA polymerase sigma factor [Acetonema longum]EGO62270.1 hypothetical protein ALO_18887 [Acetonema longum DSM 6540]
MLNELVKRAQAGDMDAYTAVCLRFGNLIRKQARQTHLTPLREEAEAEGWLAVVRAVQQYREDLKIPFAGYAAQCIQYRIWNLFKRERRRWSREIPLTETDETNAGTFPVAAAAAPVDVAAQAETAILDAIVRQALAELPEKQRLAVMETIMHGRKLAELARLWGITPQAVYSFRKRGLANLKIRLSEQV